MRRLASLPAVTEQSNPSTPGGPPTPSSPADVYRSLVAEIIDGRESRSPYPPGAPQLTIVRRHQPRSLAELSADELVQLHAALFEQEGHPLSALLADEETSVEAAEVVDAAGVLRYRLYGWNYGGGILFPPSGVDVVAFAAQHDMEHWSVDQRDLFAGMDRALRAGGHGFDQPLHFCWDDDNCWDQIAGAAPGSVGSEPYLREIFARAAQVVPH
jgi:hypothetical protein